MILIFANLDFFPYCNSVKGKEAFKKEEEEKKEIIYFHFVSQSVDPAGSDCWYVENGRLP